jgi:hypothetical protein
VSGDRLVWVSPGPPARYLPYQPCPGDVDAVRALATRWRVQGDAVARVRRRLEGWDPARWQDSASRAAVARLAGLHRAAAALSSSLADAAAALDGWAQRLSALRAEADALDAEAGELHRALDERAVDALGHDTLAAQLDWGEAARRDALRLELAAVERRADALHDRYVAESRAASQVLDATAPTDAHALDRWDRGLRDLTDDGVRLVGRTGARVLDIHATTAGRASAVAGTVSLVVPPTAAVLGPVGLGLAGASLQNRVVLSEVADGSGDAVGWATLGVGLGAVGTTGAAVSAGAAVRGAVVVDGSADAVGGAATGAGVGLEVKALVEQEPDRPTSASLPTGDGADLEVTAHTVAEPWHASDGFVGRGFAGVAMTAVPACSLRPSGPARAPVPPRFSAPGCAPVPSSTTTTQASGSGPADRPASGEGDHQDRVRRGGL